MKGVHFDPSTLTGDQAAWWAKWQKRADDATIEAIDAWERGDKVKFNDAIWGDLKEWLLANVFHGKCAYCETLAPRFPGHAEHFRPKGRVDIRDPATGRAVPATVEWPDGTIAPHPGYFWLAYHWKNLLPACQACNSGRGKQNQFPLVAPHKHALVPALTAAQAKELAKRARASVKWKQHYYLDPDALDELEGPQILNPYVEDPRKHLRFGEGGIVTAIDDSDKGKESIRVYQLDDDKLRIDRQKQQEKANLIYRSKLASNIIERKPDPFQAARTALADFEQGLEEYSVAALDYIEIVIRQIQPASQPGGGG